MKGKKLKLSLLFVVVLLFGAAGAVQGDWNEGDSNKMHYPQLPKPGGWDVALFSTGSIWLADDWQCSQTGPVSDIHFWVSWEDDMVQPLNGFAVRIWSDDPCGPNGYSEPNGLLWERDFYAGDFTVHDMPNDLQGWFDPYWHGWDPCDHTRWAQVNITDINKPFIQQEGEVYWLMIDVWAGGRIGWKQSGSPHFRDNAVYYDGLSWVELRDPNTDESLDLAFVITEEEVSYKWVQGPDLTDINGVDVDATHWGPIEPLWDMQLLADDFWCNKTGPITDIYVWGSYYDDKLPTNGPNNVDFWIDIFSDNPVGPNDWSEPNEWLWTHIFYKGEFDVWPYAEDLNEGYYSPCTALYKTISDSTCWLYHFHIDACDPCAFVQEQGNVYWLVVQACPYTSPWDPNVRFGWKTSTNHWRDDAVWALGWVGGHGPWQELLYPTGHPFEGNTIDLAFAIAGEEGLPPPTVIYVDVSATGNNDGSSWSNAYNLLQDALAAASSGNYTILVAEGTYKPDQGGGQIPGSRTATFQLQNNVAIYGGFPSGGCVGWTGRYIKGHETILSGDLSGNDVDVNDPCDLPTEPNRAENSYHVVTGSGTDATAILDGFTITAGNANAGAWPDNEGGGMFNSLANCTVNKCKFVENSSSAGGGAMRNDNQSNLHASNCIFFRNAGGGGGGGVKNYDSSPTLVNCSFISNKGFTGGHNGGGLYNISSSPAVTNCLFSNNSAVYGGAVSNIVGSCPTITNCTFSANWASVFSGAINNWNNSYPIITNCIFWGNNAPAGSQIGDSGGSAATVNYSDVQGGWWGAGISNINADPCFVDADGTDNVIGTLDDNITLSLDSPCIDIGDNTAVPCCVCTDVDGRLRIADGDCDDREIVDMGASEFAYLYLGDLDGDFDIDFKDFAIFANNWLVSGR